MHAAQSADRGRSDLVWHQAHPFRVVVDAVSAVVAVWLLWKHHLVLGILVAIVPSLLASAYLLAAARASSYGDWPLTRFFAASLVGPLQLLRLAGLVLAAIAGWYHTWWLVAIGAALYALSWSRGLFAGARGSGPPA